MKPLSYLVALMMLAFAAAGQTVSPSVSQSLAIWPGVAPGSVDPPTEETKDGDSYSGIGKPTLTAYYAEKPSGAAVVVLPGGGYSKIVYVKEGAEIALWLNSIGIDAYVLKYRLPTEGFNPDDAAFADAQRAIRLVRSGAAGRHTDPHRIGVIGFSAGGHLAAMMGAYYDTKFYEPVDDYDRISARPNFMILGYAAITPRTNLLVPINAPPKYMHLMRLESHYPFETAVNAQTPPAFIFAGKADAKVPYAYSVVAAKALHDAKVPVELHLFEGAPHGFALRGSGPEKQWPDLCTKWLRAGSIIPAEH